MKKNIVIAVLSCLFCAWIASAQSTTIPIKVTFTWNDGAHTPLSGNNFVGQQLMSVEKDATGKPTQFDYFQFCTAPLDSTGTASCNLVYNPAGLNSFTFLLVNAQNGSAFCDTNHQCFLDLDLDTDMINQAASKATVTNPLLVTVRLSTANNTIASFSFNQ